MDILETIGQSAKTKEIGSAYKSFFENSTDALFILEAEGPDAGKILLANQSAADMHGYSLEDFLELNIRDLDSHRDIELIPGRIKRILSGERISFELVHRRKDGSEFPMEVSAGPLWVNGRTYIMSINRDVTERKETEQMVREREKFIESITKASPEVVYVFDLHERKNIYFNKRFGEVLGYSDEELDKMEPDVMSNLLHPEDLRRLPGLLERWKTTGDGEVIETEYRMKHKSGEWRWFLGRDTVFLRNESGDVAQFVGTASDRTERKNADLALQQSLSVLNATLESTEDGILVVDTVGKITAYNKKFLSLWSIPAEAVEDKKHNNLIEFVSPQLADPERFRQFIGQAFSNKTLEAHDVIDFKDGRTFEQFSKPQWIGDEVVGRVWNFRDVTIRIQKENSLIESEERFKRLQEASFGGIFIHDEGKILDANHGLCNITGYSMDELIGMDGLQLIAPEYREHVTQKVRVNAELPYDVIGVRKDGTRYHLEIHGKTIPFQHKNVRVTEFRDVTNRKQIEESVREQNVRLVSIAENLTRKNAQLEEFTQIVSHNLRSPAGNILALLSLLQQASGEDQKEYFRHLHDSSQLLLNTLKHLNDVLRIKQDKNIERQALKFASVYEDVRLMLQAKIEEYNADVEADFHEAEEINYPFIYLESILLNLMGNALKYHSPRRRPIIRLRTFYKGRQLFLEIRDNGQGIDLERYRHQMFKMRKTFHHHPESQGLGLFLIKNQIEAMGGEITLESQVNKGATFTVNFNKYEAG